MKKPLFRMILCLLLSVIMIFTACTANAPLTEPDGGEQEDEQDELIEEEEDSSQFKTVKNSDNVSMAISSIDSDSDVQLSIKEVKDVVIPEGIDADVKAYDFVSDGVDEFISLIDLSIPYDDSLIEDGQDPGICVNAAYYNEETKDWEPVIYSVDTENKTVNIVTDHLSTYGIFTFKNEYTRHASVSLPSYKSSLPISDMSDYSYVSIIEESWSNGGQPGDLSFQYGFELTNEMMGLSGNGITFMTETVLKSTFFSGLGDLITEMGLIGAFIQAAYDWNKDDNGLALKTNLAKNLTYYAIGKWGSRVAKLAAVGVFAIDYSLNAFATEAWSGRQDQYTRAYLIYYDDLRRQKKQAGTSVARELYYKVYDAYKKVETDPNYDLNAGIQKIVDDHSNLFWQLSDTDIGEYQTRAGVTFSAGGGLNEKMKKDISKEYSDLLMQTTMQPIFAQVGRKLTYELEVEYFNAYKSIRDELNKKIKVNIFETQYVEGKTPKYANCQVRFAPLDENVDKSKWSGVLKADASANTYFTVLGYLQSGTPTKLNIYEPDANMDTDEPIKTMDFELAESIDFELADKAPTLEELVGVWNNPANLLTVAAIDVPWDQIRAAANEPPVENEDGTTDECEINQLNINIDDVQSQIEDKVGTSNQMVFSITADNETKGTLTITDFPGSVEDDSCEILMNYPFKFKYDEEKGTCEITQYSMKSFLAKTMESYDASLSSGKGIFRARFDKIDGVEVIVLEGDLDLNINDPGSGINVHLKFNMYGVK